MLTGRSHGRLGASPRRRVWVTSLASSPSTPREMDPVSVIAKEMSIVHGNLPAVAEQAQQLQALAEVPDVAREMALYDLAPAARAGLGDELRAFALVKIGDIEIWAGRLDQAESHPEQGVVLARRIGRPYLEFMGLVYRAEIELNRPFSRGQKSAPGRRSTWPSDTAGPTNLTLATPT